MNPATATDVCHQVQTSNGLTVDIEWSLAYNIDPFQIKPESQAKLARTLPRKSGKVAAKHVNNVIRHIIGQNRIEDLHVPGVQNRLEREIRQQVTARLSKLGFKISRVMIGAIIVPPQVQAALESAHEQRLQTEQEALALERLHQVISRFSEADMQRLMELERIQKMGRNGVALMYTPHAQAPVINENRLNKKSMPYYIIGSSKAFGMIVSNGQ
jgi:regulator of protease activity HflC (stomatin/prohibitin superfamily)